MQAPLRQPTAACPSRRDVRCCGLKDNVAQLPTTTDVKRVRIPELQHTIENVEGKKASVAIYSAIAAQHGGRLNERGARRALELYAEAAEDAKQHPGSHPNIDILLKVLEQKLDLELLVERA